MNSDTPMNQVMKTAWAIIKKHGLSLSEAMKKAWASWRIKKAMKAGNARFIFKKKDNSIREALGTLNIDYERKSKRKPNYTMVSFFDVEAQAWRAYSVVNLFTK